MSKLESFARYARGLGLDSPAPQVGEGDRGLGSSVAQNVLSMHKGLGSIPRTLSPKERTSLGECSGKQELL